MENSEMKENSRAKENVRQFVLYLVVGGIATIVEWVIFYILNRFNYIHYMGATALAFVVSTFDNWLFCRLMLFKERENIWKELLKIYATSVVGLLMNLLLMWLAVEIFALPEMISKMIATGIVFMWNFLIRKFVIYKM